MSWGNKTDRRKDNRLILLYKGLKGKARIPTVDLIPKTRRGRNQHSLAFQIPSASKDVYMYSFFPQTIRDWNDLPESLISSSDNDEIELKQPVSKLASILLGELVAIQITLNYLIEEKKVRDISTILIFCDSQSAVGILQLGWENKSYKKTAMDIQQSLNILERDVTEVKIQWSPGHANIRGNEMADRLAKEATKEAEEMTDDIGIASQSDVKSAARESVNIKWQQDGKCQKKEGIYLHTDLV